MPEIALLDWMAPLQILTPKTCMEACGINDRLSEHAEFLYAVDLWAISHD